MVVSRTSMKVGITTATAISQGLTDRLASRTGAWRRSLRGGRKNGTSRGY